MNDQGKSLRALVNDWIGSREHFKVARLGRSMKLPWRVVQVEVARSSGTLAIVFFRHDDGSWCVYPPPIVRPAINFAC